MTVPIEAHVAAMRVPIEIWYDAACDDWMAQPVEWPDDDSGARPGLFADDYSAAIIHIRQEIAAFIYYHKWGMPR